MNSVGVIFYGDPGEIPQPKKVQSQHKLHLYQQNSADQVPQPNLVQSQHELSPFAVTASPACMRLRMYIPATANRFSLHSPSSIEIFAFSADSCQFVNRSWIFIILLLL